MCGLAGIFDIRGLRPMDGNLLARMNEVQFHRGPDEGGQHLEPGLGLAHRRLSIIDLSSGQQPMHSADNGLVLVYNGEIYNFPQLMQQLQAAGHRFRTHCDTEVILYAWREWGERCVDHFRGMFAFALWDRSAGTLFLARDRLGVKPLYYAETADGRLLFASELKSLLVDPALAREVDPEAVEDYFTFGYVPDPRTIFRGMHKLAPGHTLTVRRGEPLPAPRAYWDVRFDDNGVRNEGEACEELVERLREAVRIRLVAEVPLGAFLSGGVDSSAVVAMMAGLSADPVNTCSISFGDPAYNESAYAADVAQRYGTRHHVEQVDPDDFGLIDQLALLYDEPFADSSALPTYRVCELARKRVTVALSGDGGDEGLAGYRRYRGHLHEERMRTMIPAGLRRPLFGALGRVYPKLDWAPRFLRGRATFEALARNSAEGYLHGVSINRSAQREALFSPEMRRRLNGYRSIEVFRRHLENAPSHPLSQVQYLDYKTYLPGDILTKVDRASMAHALEVRVPILDHELVGWIAGLPPEMKLRGQEGKYVFKRAMEPYLPESILYRRKMGFAVPISNWFRGSMRDRLRATLLEGHLRDTGLFDMKYVARLIEEHASGRHEHSAPLWSLLMYESFQRQVVDGAKSSRPPLPGEDGQALAGERI
ncbi:MAG: amidotransferase 1, exosortase A system-associated [Gammaproteobacteria bacterium]|jgi:asparagine synthase (glutamine-hydrolysing)|nr:amidotransferase 1, exosortase A system-associated [Gammaproteobacteria bacterium]